ncbi:putative Alanyl dipeptidyl peptidase [Monocercomonoides exilis]|uniref:putative Alanyl dipeptidyl peptidase n=1 Tax=Monocercomonoides exilis TaxID=2049356 RepID=UPI0035598F2B|nr:putative Alanyl dipeptidyl peptidase [Monocercomonoides exilis]|eukprot:MONOS_13786.1-p1 / transcript=MONOS_13786.1 / gene=MONOS_13786 / organism=Monocercomonoides_exilis_PA203 / gene_product=Alanyl dipeptidyl peptidase / transcript_product=Alanyl dipeptidyl peptidase / location=Mono_scaffold00883:14178-16589(+) / protein_length=757 / sequence_SO=supercontig / SO=protein_coding / is_pseudo=false
MCPLFFFAILLQWSCYSLKPYTINEHIQMEKLQAYAVSPDSQNVVAYTKQFNIQTKQTTWKLYLISLLTKEKKALTIPYPSISDLKWSPENNIISFITTVNGKCTFVLCNPIEDKCKEIYTFPIPVSSVRWSPTGKYLSFSAEVYVGKSLKETANIDKEKENQLYNKKGYDQLFVYHWDEYLEGKFNHLHYVKVDRVDGDEFVFKISGDAVDIMPQMDGDCPSKPWGGIEEYNFSPDEKYIAFSTQTGKDQAWSISKQVFLHKIGTKSVEQISKGVGRYMNPVFDEDRTNGEVGWNRIFFAGTRIIQREADKGRIMVYEKFRGEARELDVQCDESIESFVWAGAEGNQALHPDSLFAADGDEKKESLLAVSKIRGRSYISRFDANLGNKIMMSEAFSIHSFEVMSDGRIICMKSTYVQPPELFILSFKQNADSKENSFFSSQFNHFASKDQIIETAEQLTFFSQPTLAEVYPLIQPLDIYYTGANGDKIHGFYFSPLKTSATNAEDGLTRSGKASTRYPLMMYIHGGPENSWLDEWSERWNPQIIAHQGIAVFAPNVHGGDTYGQWFTDSVIGNWGTLPYDDVLMGMAHVLCDGATPDELDGSRVGAMGASFGGYMINWIQSQTSVFNVLFSHDGIFDLESTYEDADELYSLETPFLGMPWDDLKNANKPKTIYKTQSPSTYATPDSPHFNTPQLTSHGGRDYRCTSSQGIAIYHTLQTKGTPARFVYFPSENHWVLNPLNSIRWHHEVVSWIKMYL